MVTTALTPAQRRLAVPDAVKPYLNGYAAAWVALLTLAVLVAAIGPLRHVLQSLIPIDYKTPPRREHPPTVHTFTRIFFNNARLMLAPLALTIAAGPRSRALRTVGDVLIGAFVLFNLLPFAVDLGTWGWRLLPYIPHAPLEIAAFTAGPVTWFTGTRRPLPGRLIGQVAVFIVLLLIAAAAAETWLMP